MVTVLPRSDLGFQRSARVAAVSRPGVPGVTRCVTNLKGGGAAAFGKRIRVRRGPGDGVRVGRGSGLRGVLGDSTAGSGGAGVGALIETNLSST